MNTVLIIVIVVVTIPVLYFLSPAARGHWTLQGRLNEWAWKRNAAGKGNFMTKPIWGKRARPPKYLQEHDPDFKDWQPGD